MLPECGLIVERDGIPKLAAWLYQDNSCGVAWLAWVTKNPAIHARETATDVKVLLGAVDEIARTQNRHTVICTTKVRGLGRTLMRCGYAANHEVMEYFRGVPHGS
ncbi:hypothetical protein OpiT1DRAFT_03834 [Opitutaceae bacterium TAV1]|nr:hypothetical protein OpiT1DRAFT_03834 [Opitutaceae bacterium TAV1]